MKIKFKNFALFDDSNIFELSPLTFLIGGNNCGKSTFIKGLEAIGNGLLDVNYFKKDKKEVLTFSEVTSGLYRKQTFEKVEYEQNCIYYERSFSFVNSKDKEILKVSPFNGNKAKENVVFYVERFLDLLEENGLKISNEEVNLFLRGYSIIKKHVNIENESLSRDVFKPTKEIQTLERWFFDVGILQIFELEYYGEDFKKNIINLFIECFKPYTFEAFIKSENNENRFWNNSRKLLTIEKVGNSDLTKAKSIYKDILMNLSIDLIIDLLMKGLFLIML